jgi:proteic killer suppression protein
MIRSFRDKDAERLYERRFSRRLQTIEKAARIRLELLDAATSLADLKLPGLRLEALKGDRMGQYSVRAKDQHRVCFRWQDRDAYDVEIVDYH